MDNASQAERFVNAEHEVQLYLVKEIRKAIREARDTQELVARLIAWGEAHFSSEELLMRQYGYPEAETHAGEHRRLMGDLKGKIDATTIGPISEAIAQHIRVHDSRLHAFFTQAFSGDREGA